MLEAQPPDDKGRVQRILVSGLGGCALTILLFVAFPVLPMIFSVYGSALTGGNVHTGSPVLFILAVPLLTAGFGAVLFTVLRKR